MIDTLFSRIDALIPTLDGWCSPNKAKLFAAAVLALNPRNSIVIGVLGGRDTFAIAMAHQAMNRGHVQAIDPWSADASKQGQTGEHLKFWEDNPMHELIYRKFMQKKTELGLDKFITVCRASSNDVEPMNASFIIFDGNHSDQANTDIARFAPKIRLGGLAYLDDLDWPGGGVRKGEQTLLAMGFLRVYAIENGAMYQRVK